MAPAWALPAFGAALAATLAAIALADLRTLRIPDPLTLALAGLGLSYRALSGPGETGRALLAGAAVLAAFWALRAGFRRWRGVTGLGLGDVKMAAAAALWVSPWSLPLLFLAAALSALGAVVLLGLAGPRPDRQARVPFGPFIGVGLMLAWLLEVVGLTLTGPGDPMP